MITFHVHLRKNREGPRREPFAPVREWLARLERAVLSVHLRSFGAIDPVRVRLSAQRPRAAGGRYELDLFGDDGWARLGCLFHRMRRGLSLALVMTVSLFTFSAFTVREGQASEQARGPLVEKQRVPPSAESVGFVNGLPGDCPASLVASDCLRVAGDCGAAELKRAVDRAGRPILLGAYHNNTPGLDHTNVSTHEDTPWQNHTNMVTPHSNTPWQNHINNQYPHTNVVPGDFIY